MDKLQRNYQLNIETIVTGKTVTIELPFTIEFDITRAPLSATCTANVKIYNLNETTRNSIYKDQYNTKDYRACELRAGYGKIDALPIIFKGNVTRCYSQRRGTDYITTIEVYDGAYAIMNGFSNIALEKGMKKTTAIDLLMRDLPKINKRIIGNYPGEIPRGNSLHGNTAELLKEMTSGGFFIDSETAYALGDDECTKGLVNVINSSSGLLGSPQREETLLTFDMIFEPRILMGQQLKVESATESIFNGQYKVISIQHRGTISQSVCGQAVSTFKLWFGTKLLRIITG